MQNLCTGWPMAGLFAILGGIIYGT